TAPHPPHHYMLIVHLSGSMRFQSLPCSPLSNKDVNGNSGTFAYAAAPNPRNVSLNPDPVFPQFGHYSDTGTAALQGTTGYPGYTGEYVDLSNISSNQNSGPPIVQDFYQNPPRTPPRPGNVGWSGAASGYATAPGGDNYLKTSLDTGAAYAKTVQDFNSGITNTNPTFETQGYAAFGGRTQFYGYTQGPNYWGKTFWIW